MFINIYSFNENQIYYRFATKVNSENIIELKLHNYQNINDNAEQIIYNLSYLYEQSGNNLFENQFSGFSMSENKSSEEIELVLIHASSEEMVEGITQMLEFQIDCWDNQFNRNSNIPNSNFPKIPVWEEAEYPLIMDRCEAGDTVARNALVTLGELVVNGGYYPPRKMAA